MTTISMTPSTRPMPRWLHALLPWCRRRIEHLADAAGSASADDATAYQVPLAHGTVRRFTRPRGLRLNCVRGALWITVDGDLADHVLAAGESFEPASARRVLVYGLDDAVLRVMPRPARPGQAARRTRLVVQADPA